LTEIEHTSDLAPTSFGRGYAIALLSSIILSTTAIFIRYLTQTYQMPALILAFWRDILVTVTLTSVLGLFKPVLLKIDRRRIWFYIAYGIVLAIFNSVWTLSVALNGASIATVLAYSSAAFTVLFGWLLLKENVGWVKIVVVLLSLVGCVLVADALNVGIWHANPVGILAGLVSGLAYAGYSLMGRSAAQKGLNTWTTILFIFAFASIILLVINLLPGEIIPGTAENPSDMFWLQDAWEGWIILILLAIGPTLVGYGIYNLSLVYLPASVTNLVLTTEPVFTALIAYFTLGERFTTDQILGSLLILAGVILLRLYEGRKIVIK